ncbi:hypothetical protein K438DRAFT_1774913 [Mycena galopus ATCC 62051]|nr:hypothetical protein K438DRAFT_1774913 [Mycena galopus ATCC 62051]
MTEHDKRARRSVANERVCGSRRKDGARESSKQRTRANAAHKKIGIKGKTRALEPLLPGAVDVAYEWPPRRRIPAASVPTLFYCMPTLTSEIGTTSAPSLVRWRCRSRSLWGTGASAARKARRRTRGERRSNSADRKGGDGGGLGLARLGGSRVRPRPALRAPHVGVESGVEVAGHRLASGATNTRGSVELASEVTSSLTGWSVEGGCSRARRLACEVPSGVTSWVSGVREKRAVTDSLRWAAMAAYGSWRGLAWATGMSDRNGSGELTK